MNTPEPGSPTIQFAEVSDLRLDRENPRLPESLIGAGEADIVKWFFDSQVLEELGRSFLDNGFFAHEPLIVLPPAADRSQVVVEGNRRLAALTVLLQLPSAVNAGVNFNFDRDPTPGQLDRLRSVPVFTVGNRDAIREFLGFRHIGGLKTWSPEAKARYLEREIDDLKDVQDEDRFRAVARMVGSTVPAVRGQYLALKVLRAAAEDYRLNTRYIVTERFGVWNRLMNSPEVRHYIGLGDSTNYSGIRQSMSRLDAAGLKQVVADLTPKADGQSAVLSDSRNVTIYGRVLANKRAEETLKKHGSLELARQIVERGRLNERIRLAQRTIDLITQDIDGLELDDESLDVARALWGSARTLRSAISDRLKDSDDDD